MSTRLAHHTRYRRFAPNISASRVGGADQYGVECVARDLIAERTRIERFNRRRTSRPTDGVAGGTNETAGIDRGANAQLIEQLDAARWQGFGQRSSCRDSTQYDDCSTPRREQARRRGACRPATHDRDVDDVGCQLPRAVARFDADTYAPGVTPKIRLNVRVRWLWSANPQR